MKILAQPKYLIPSTQEAAETELARTNEDLLIFFLSMFTTIQLEESLSEQRHASAYELAGEAI